MRDFLFGSSVSAAYIVIAIALAVLVQRLCRISSEALRKTLHFILLGSYIPLTVAFSVWWHAAIFASVLIALVFPFLLILNRVPLLSGLLVERWRGEYFGSMMMALFAMLITVCVCWGYCGDRYLVLASVYAWGIGDGVAALVGRRYGNHKILWRFADAHKSVEGSLCMLACSFLSVFTLLIIRGGISMPAGILISLLTGAATTLGEMCARNGLDTLVCPTVAMGVLLPLVRLFGG